MKTKGKGFWPLLGSYIKDQRRVIYTTGLLLALFALLTYLYALPWEPVLYGSLLAGFFLLLWLGWYFRSWRKRHRQLTLLATQVEGCWHHLPQGESLLEEDYQALITAMGKSHEGLMSSRIGEYNENMEYFTLWAHQIKTPIAAIRLLIQSEDTPFVKEMLEELWRTEQYVEMVLLYIKLKDQNSDYLIKKQALDPIIKQAIRRYSSQFIRKKITLSYTTADFSTITDEKWLQFVIEQVLSNSLKYTPPKGNIKIWADDQQNLWMKDSGIGIPKEDLPRVFEKGYTGFHGRADKRATGIGLYLCRRICEKLGHTMVITSNLGEGTTVKIALANYGIKVE